jgi:hypothetical protein
MKLKSPAVFKEHADTGLNVNLWQANFAAVLNFESVAIVIHTKALAWNGSFWAVE